MDYTTDQNQYYQYYDPYQQSTTNDLSSQAQSYDQSSSAQPYYDYSAQPYYNSYLQQRSANDQSSLASSYYTHEDYSNSYQYQYQPQSGSTVQYPIAVNPTQSATATVQHSLFYPQPYGSARVNRQTPQPFRGGRGGGRRGGRPFRGGARGRGEPVGRARGRGQIGRRLLPPNSGLNPASSSSLSLAQESLSRPPKRLPHVVWCEICKIDCTTLENLEVHKSGKKHKKNLQALEHLKANNTFGERQNLRNQGSESNPEDKNVQTVGAVGSQEATVQMDNSNPTPVGTDGNKNESEKQETMEEKSEILSSINSAENPSSIADDEKKDESEKRINPEETTFTAAYATGKPRWSNNNNNNNAQTGFQGHGRALKRSRRGGRVKRGGRGGKFLRSDDGSRRPVEPLKPKEVIPYICELCNVKCDTQIVFNCHLAGRKHLANVKRFHDNLGASSSSAIPQASVVQQDTADPQVLLAQLLNVVLQQAQTQQSQTPEQVAMLAQAQKLLTPLLHKSETASEPVSRIASAAGAENLQIPAEPEPEATSQGDTGTTTIDEASLSEKNEADCGEDKDKVQAAATEDAEEVPAN